MKIKSSQRYRIHNFFTGGATLAAAACLALCAPSVRAGTTSITFGFQKGNLTTNTIAYGSGSGYTGVVDGRITDNTGTSPLSTGLTATIGNQFNSLAGTNGQQHVGLFSYDLSELSSFIAANTGPNSSVSIASVSMTVVSAGGNSSAQGIALYGTDPFTLSGCTWSNYTTGVQWTVPFQNLGSPTNTAPFCYTGGGSALTLSLGGANPLTSVTGGNNLTWTSSSNFIATITNALARADKTVYLTTRVTFLSNSDNRLNVITSATNTVAFRPQLQITVNVTTTAASATWTGASGTSWTTAGNWLGSVVPVTDSPIIFDNNSVANLSTLLNQDFSVTSISVTNPTGPVSIGGANTLTNGIGGIDLSAATQDLAINAPLVLGANQTWNVGAGRTLSIGGAVTGSANLTISGAGKVSLTAANVLPNGANAGGLTLGGTLNLNGTAQSINTLSGSGVLDNTAGGAASLTLTNGSFSGTIQNTGGALALVKNSSSGLVLSGTNTYSGGTTLNGGTLSPGNTNAVGTGTVTVNSGSIFYPVATMGFANAVTLNGGALEIGGGNGNVSRYWGPITVTADSAIKADGGTFGTSVVGGVAMGSGGYTLTSFNNNSGNGNTISGQITGANGTIVNTGVGTLWITGSNTFAGTFRTTNSGSLSFQNTYAAQNATLDMNATDLGAVGFTVDAVLGALTGSRDLNMSSRAISIGNNNASTLYSGAMTNAGSLTKIGNGTLTLSGVNTYTFKTVVNAGTLALSGSGSVASANIVVAGGARLDVSGLASTFALGSRTLTNSSVGAVLNGASICTNGTLSLVYNGVNPAFIQTNGTMTLSASSTIIVNNTGATPLSPGSYTIISAATAGNVGQVTGSLPGVTVTGNGANGTASLQLNGSGGLDLVVTSLALSQPAINQVKILGGNFILQGTNGTASTSYSILTATNLTTPLSNWTTNATGVFGAGGTFSNGIPVGTEPTRFFQIKTP